MNVVSVWVIFTIAVSLSLVAGALAALSWKGRVTRKKERVPLYWPINNRRVVNSEELKVWSWLIKTFPEHHILVKIPITRFTIPQDKQKGLELYKLLNALYCNFTVCSADGKVVGCIDIPVARQISKRHMQIKEKILFQCQIGYSVMSSSSLPEPSAIRSKFLGEASGVLNGAETEDQEKKATKAIMESYAPTIKKTAVRVDNSNIDAGDFWSELNQQNSFLAPLDSRRAELAKDRRL